jgi:putative FmdB family regulatory protein
MPIYDYRCDKCGNDFEIEQRISESPIKKCPKCGGKVTRLISNTSFVLKGSGWYVTDYARKGKTEEKQNSEAKTTDKKQAKA